MNMNVLQYDWPTTVFAISVICLGVINFSAQSKPARWVVALIFNTALVSTLVLGSFFIAQHNGWKPAEYTLTVWSATYPIWLMLLAAIAVGFAALMAEYPRKSKV